MIALTQYRRPLVAGAFFVLGAALGYKYHVELITLLQRPAGRQLYYGLVPGPAVTWWISLAVGCMVAIPSFVYLIISLAVPDFDSQMSESRRIGLILMSALLVGAGIACGLWVFLPLAVHFLILYSGQTVRSLLTTDDYFSFAMTLLATLVIMFQLPLVILLINGFKRLSSRYLLGYAKYVALLSPLILLALPLSFDVVTKLILAILIFCLYMISIGLLALSSVSNRSDRAMAGAAQLTTAPPVSPEPKVRRASTINLRLHDARTGSKVADTKKRP